MKMRMWCEVVLAAVSAVLTVMTAFWPSWIELVSRESPDGGDGSVERLLALAFLAATLLFVALARRNQRALRAA